MAFEKGKSGNPNGRPRGIKDKRTKLREQLAAKGDVLLKKAIALGESGNFDALRFLLSRLLPPARELPVDLEAQSNLTKQGETILSECFSGNIAPSVALNLLASLKSQSEIRINNELEQRIQKLEAAVKEQVL